MTLNATAEEVEIEVRCLRKKNLCFNVLLKKLDFPFLCKEVDNPLEKKPDEGERNANHHQRKRAE